MGVEFFKRPFGGTFGLTDTVETVTSTGTSLRGDGTSIISASTNADRTFKLARPSAAGVHKTVIVQVNASTDVVAVRCASTADTLYGSTNNILTATTGANVQACAQLVAVSATQWALVSKTTGFTIS